jgi:hypothetical protein
MNCIQCGSEIESKPNARGRPQRYCSTSCRRTAEFEIRRVNGLLGRLEERLSNLRSASIPIMGEDPAKSQRRSRGSKRGFACCWADRRERGGRLAVYQYTVYQLWWR